MSKRVLLATLLIGVLGVASLTAAPVGVENTNAMLRVAGQLTLIDGQWLTVVPTAGHPIIIRYTGATKISRDGDKAAEPLKFEDLKVGQQVRAYYSNNDKAVFGVIIDLSPEANAGSPSQTR